jgi:hypothetical protein
MNKATISLLALGLAASAYPAETWDTLYSSKYAYWVTEPSNLEMCRKYKANIDSIAAELDQAIPLVKTMLGIGPAKLPQRVQVDSGTDGMGGWAGGGDVGYQISDFFGRPEQSDGLRWIRGVIIGEVINVTTGTVTDNWPRDWWVDDVWYFPGFLAGEILKETVSPDFSDYWLTSEHYPTYPVYNIFTALLKEKGWGFWQAFFARIKDDKMQWGPIGANPSKIKTDYVIAYLGLAVGRNLGDAFKTAKVAAADSAEVGAIMYVEQALRQGDKDGKNTASAWTDFRKGNYASAKTKLDNLGIIVVSVFRPWHGVVESPRFRYFSLTGRALAGRTLDAGFYVRRENHPGPGTAARGAGAQRAGSTQRNP